LSLDCKQRPTERVSTAATDLDLVNKMAQHAKTLMFVFGGCSSCIEEGVGGVNVAEVGRSREGGTILALGWNGGRLVLYEGS
jgi:hypothetical protein